MDPLRTLHPLLRRQIRREFDGDVPAGLAAFVGLVDAAYVQADLDREMTERSMDVVSEELVVQNDRLRQELDERRQAQRRLEREIERHRVTSRARDAAEDARAQAEDLLELKSSFLANMSHELRTPLTGILGYAELLLDEVEGEPREMVSAVRRGAQRLYETVNSVLDLAQLDSGGMRLTLGPVDVAAEAADAITLLAPVARARGLDLRLDARAPCLARADRAALHRVVNNLVGNALKFTQRGGIMVAVAQRDGRAELRVRDTGPGIAPDFLPHLYDAFRQASSGHARTHEGNGLGLAITARLMELMDGEIDVEDTSPAGTTFRVRLPLARAQGARPALGPMRLAVASREALGTG